MSIDQAIHDETDLQRIDAVLADWGHITRRARAQTLTEEDFEGLMKRIRQRLLAFRADLMELEDDVIELTDAGQMIAEAAQLGRRPELQQLIRRCPGLMTAQQLADNPGISRARRYGDFAAIDGGIAS